MFPIIIFLRHRQAAKIVYSRSCDKSLTTTITRQTELDKVIAPSASEQLFGLYSIFYFYSVFIFFYSISITVFSQMNSISKRELFPTPNSCIFVHRIDRLTSQVFLLIKCFPFKSGFIAIFLVLFWTYTE